MHTLYRALFHLSAQFFFFCFIFPSLQRYCVSKNYVTPTHWMWSTASSSQAGGKSSCRWHLDQHTSYVRCLLHPLHSSLSTQSPLCSFKDDPPFHTDLLADRHWWIDRPTLLIGFLLLFFSFFLFPFHPFVFKHTDSQADSDPSCPNNASYLSYLLRAVVYAGSKEIFCVVCQASD